MMDTEDTGHRQPQQIREVVRIINPLQDIIITETAGITVPQTPTAVQVEEVHIIRTAVAAVVLPIMAVEVTEADAAAVEAMEVDEAAAEADAEEGNFQMLSNK